MIEAENLRLIFILITVVVLVSVCLVMLRQGLKSKRDTRETICDHCGSEVPDPTPPTCAQCGHELSMESMRPDHASWSPALAIIAIGGLMVLLIGSVKIGFAVKLILGLAVAAVAMAVCLWLIRFGFRGKRVGDTPFCKACGYNLTGLTSNACPECGSTMSTEAIVYGHSRRRRPWLALFGVAGLAGWTFTGVQFGRQVNWYQVQPTVLLVWNLSSSDTAVVSRAWRELDRRAGKGELSDTRQSRLIDICLAEQAAVTDRPITRTMIDFLGTAYAAGRISPEQEATFFKQIIRIDVQTRPLVVLGNWVPVKVRSSSRCPSTGDLYIHQGPAIELWLDGVRTDRSIGGSSTLTGNSRSTTSSSIPCDQLGQHTLVARIPVAVMRGTARDLHQDTVCHESTFDAKAAFRIVESAEEDQIRLVKDASLKVEMMMAILPGTLKRLAEGPNPYLDIEVEINHLPENVAFDIIARDADGETLLTTMSMRKGSSTHLSTGSTNVPQAQEIDLIFRSNPDLIRRTVDIFEIWDGELVYKDVEIQDEGSSKQ